MLWRSGAGFWKLLRAPLLSVAAPPLASPHLHGSRASCNTTFRPSLLQAMFVRELHSMLPGVAALIDRALQQLLSQQKAKQDWLCAKLVQLRHSCCCTDSACWLLHTTPAARVLTRWCGLAAVTRHSPRVVSWQKAHGQQTTQKTGYRQVCFHSCQAPATADIS